MTKADAQRALTSVILAARDMMVYVVRNQRRDSPASLALQVGEVGRCS